MVRSTYILFVLWLGLGLPGLAQHIVWEKVFGAQGVSSDGLGAITALEDGTFLAIGYSDLYGGYVSNTNLGSLEGAILMRLDENGDTIFVRKLNFMINDVNNHAPYIGHKYGDIYWAAFWAAIQVGPSWISCPVVVEFTADGFILQTHIYSQYQDWLVTGAVATSDYGLILSGTFNGGLSLPTQMTSIKVNFLGEVEWANKWFPPAQVRGIGNRIFQTKPNEYLITGTLGRRIGGFTFDSLGNQIDTKVFYETPSNYQFLQGEATIADFKSTVSAGQYRNGSNQTIGYFGQMDSLGNNVWGGEQQGFFKSPQSNTDGSLWVQAYNQSTNWIDLNKHGKDSSLLKSIPIIQAVTWSKVWYQYQPIGNNQVIAVGFQGTPNFGYQFLITKIDSFGTPITSVNPSLQKPPKDFREIVAFPNPTAQSIQFKNLDRPGVLQLYNLKGQKIWEQAILPEKEVPLQSLSSGTYLWHIATDNQKVYSGKFLKE